MISSASVTVSAPTTQPVLSLVFIVMMPLPPRDCVRYSSKAVRLPMPFSPATRSVEPGSTTASATTRSSLSREMPRTPVAGRPMLRTSDSSKRMLMPSRVMRTASLVPLVRRTSMRLSPCSIPMAMMPPLRTLAKSSSAVFFTVPCCVAKRMKFGWLQVTSSPLSFLRDSMRMSAATFSPGRISSRFAMERPLEARVPSGISCTRST